MEKIFPRITKKNKLYGSIVDPDDYHYKYKATFGCNKNRQFKISMSGKYCRKSKTYYYPSSTSYKKGNKVNLGDLARLCI